MQKLGTHTHSHTNAVGQSAHTCSRKSINNDIIIINISRSSSSGSSSIRLTDFKAYTQAPGSTRPLAYIIMATTSTSAPTPTAQLAASWRENIYISVSTRHELVGRGVADGNGDGNGSH